MITHDFAKPVAALALALVVSAPASGQGVFIQAAESGQGVLRARGSDCFVLTPLHVIGTTLGTIRVVGDQATEGKAELLREFPGDLALLRLIDRGSLRCDEWPPLSGFGAMLQTQTGGHLTTREPDGSRTLMQVGFRGMDAQRVFVRPSTTGDQLLKGMSGASLVINGALAGMLMSVENGDGNVLRLDDIMRLSDSFFAVDGKPRTTGRVVDVAAASALLDRAVKARDGSMQGQVEAVADLLANGHQFSSVNWSGVSMAGAQLARATFRSARFHFTDFSYADGRGADFSDAGLRFALIDRATLSGANITSAYAPFLSAQNANLENAILSKGNFFDADFRGAKLSGAKLIGATLAFADLRGATLDNADLTGAYLLGAVMDATTSLKGTVFSDTDINGAAVATAGFTAAQRGGMCRHATPTASGESMVRYNVELVERWPSQRFASGFEFDTFHRSEWAFRNFAEQWLPVCRSAPNGVAAEYDARYPADVTLSVDREYLSNAGRRRDAMRRVDERLTLIKAQLSATSNLQPEPGLRAKWEAFTKNATSRVAPGPTPYVDADSMLLLMLARNALSAEQIDWVAQTRNRFTWEERSRNPQNGDPPLRSMWPPVFAEGVSWEVASGAVALFRSWTMERAKRTPEKLTLTTTLTGSESVSGGQTVIPFQQVAFWGASWPRSVSDYVQQNKIDRSRVSANRSFELSGTYDVNAAPGRSRRALLALPSPVAEYRIVVPPAAAGKGSIVEVDLTVDTLQTFPDSLLVFVTPGAARVMRGGTPAWSGTVERVESPARPERR